MLCLQRENAENYFVMNASTATTTATALTPVIEEVDLSDALPDVFHDDDSGVELEKRPRINTLGPMRIIKTVPELNEPSVSRSTDCSPLHKNDSRSSRRSLLGSLARSRLYHSLSSLDRKGKLWSKFYAEEDENVKVVRSFFFSPT